MEIDPTFARNDFVDDFVPVGLPPGDYTLGTRYPNHSDIKVPPLDAPPRCAGGRHPCTLTVYGYRVIILFVDFSMYTMYT